jgi:hypothetical protein
MIPLMLILLSALLLGTLYGAIPAVILIGVTTLISVSYCVTIGRTITMDASGCRIEICCVSKHYGWDEVVVKRLETAHLGLRSTYHNGGVFFYVVQTHKPKWLDPMLYCTLCHPFTCFFVYFATSVENSTTGATSGIYETEKEIFLKKMKEWSLDIG